MCVLLVCECKFVCEYKNNTNKYCKKEYHTQLVEWTLNELLIYLLLIYKYAFPILIRILFEHSSVCMCCLLFVHFTWTYFIKNGVDCVVLYGIDVV